MFVYLEKKHDKGNTTYHVVKPGETLLQIAQIEGMQLEALRKMNKLDKNEEPVSGSLINLKEKRNDKLEVYTVHKPEDFPGSNPRAVPPGETRTEPGYISKEEIETVSENESPEEAIINIEPQEEKPEISIVTTTSEDENKELIKEVKITEPDKLLIEKDEITKEDQVVLVEKQTTVKPDKTVVVEKTITK